MYEQQLEDVKLDRDLGVHVSSDLKVGSQYKKAYCKASQIFGLISRSIRFKNPGILNSLYKSLLRPYLEFCSPAWNPYYVKDKQLLERVQHRFTRMFSELKKLSYEKRLCKLQLWSLEERRNRADLLEIFKMVKGFSAISWTQFFHRVEGTTRGHNWKLYKHYSRCKIRLHFYSQRSIDRWNSLTQDEIDVKSINSVKNCLDKWRKHQVDFFMDWLIDKSLDCRIMDGRWLSSHAHRAKCSELPGELKRQSVSSQMVILA